MKILMNSSKKVTFVVAPTGTGKTLIGLVTLLFLALLHSRPVVYVTSSKELAT